MAADAKDFTESQWKALFKELNARGTTHGLPAPRADSLLLASWNLRQFGNLNRRKKPRQREAFRFIAGVLKHFDLIAIQEIKDDLDSLLLLHKLLPEYNLIVSDATGNNERLGYFSRFERVRRTSLAAEIDTPMTKMRQTIQDNWQLFSDEIVRYGRSRAKKKPLIKFPKFLTFDRAPFCVSFEAGSREKPLPFLAFNAHIYYGNSHKDRTDEFVALMNWLFERWGKASKIFSQNFIVFGDMNLEIQRSHTKTLKALREHIVKETKGSRRAALKSARKELGDSIKAQRVLTPFLDGYDGKPPPKIGSNLSGNERYDQIFLLLRATRQPRIREYKVFNIPALVEKALARHRLDKKGQIANIRQQISDHLPIWIRLKLPDPL